MCGVVSCGGMLQGKTQFQQKKECCAGSLEGRFLKMLVAVTGEGQRLRRQLPRRPVGSWHLL